METSLLLSPANYLITWQPCEGRKRGKKSLKRVDNVHWTFKCNVTRKGYMGILAASGGLWLGNMGCWFCRCWCWWWSWSREGGERSGGFEERSLMSSLTLTLTPPSTPLTQAPPHPQGLGVNFSFCLKCFVKVTFSDICSLIIISIWIWFRLIWKRENYLFAFTIICQRLDFQGTYQPRHQPTKALTN